MKSRIFSVALGIGFAFISASAMASAGGHNEMFPTFSCKVPETSILRMLIPGSVNVSLFLNESDAGELLVEVIPDASDREIANLVRISDFKITNKIPGTSGPHSLNAIELKGTNSATGSIVELALLVQKEPAKKVVLTMKDLGPMGTRNSPAQPVELKDCIISNLR